MSSTRLWNPVNSLTILRVSISTIRTTMSSHMMARSPLSRCRSIEGAVDGSTSVYCNFVVWKSKNYITAISVDIYTNKLCINRHWAFHPEYWQSRHYLKNRLLVQLLIYRFVLRFQNKTDLLLQVDKGQGHMTFGVRQIAYSTYWSGQRKNWPKQNFHMQ